MACLVGIMVTIFTVQQHFVDPDRLLDDAWRCRRSYTRLHEEPVDAEANDANAEEHSLRSILAPRQRARTT